MTYQEALDLVNGIKIMRESVSDSLALKCKGVYPTYATLCEKKYIAHQAGYKFTHEKKLYKTIQPDTSFVEHFVPGVGTESLFERIDEEHGTSKNDPIAYSGNMRLELGKFYSQENMIYECIRDSEIPIHGALKDLVGNYVKIAE